MAAPGVPNRTEAADYYFTYIEQVPSGDIRQIIDAQAGEALGVLNGISEEKSLARYADGKWSIREVVNHLNDCERLFVFRALWFARGFDSELPSFDQNIAITGGAADALPLKTHVQEFRGVRDASISFFRNLPESAWDRRGVASGNPFTVRALGYITAGHVAHHLKILRERYL